MRRLTMFAAAAALLIGAAATWALIAFGVIAAPAPLTEGDRPAPGAAAPASGAQTVTLVGTSLLSSGAWRGDITTRLTACRGAPVDLRLVTKSGASSDWVMDQLDKLEGSDFIIIEFSINDASLSRGMPLSKSRANHLKIIAAAKATGAKVFLATMSPAFGWRGAIRPGLAAYYNLYRELAVSEDVGLIDNDPRWRAKSASWLSAALPDDLHPTNEAMAEISGRTFEAALRPFLCPEGR